MKRFNLLLAAVAISAASFAEGVEFGYDAGVEVVSHYLWRGMYNGALSAQPTLALGWDSEKTNFRFGAWGSVGSSDWLFRKESAEGAGDGTYFIPELDVYASLNVFGVTAGFTHYYFFGGSNFFSFGEINQVMYSENSSWTEVSLGYDFETLFDIPLTVSWNTIVSGADGYVEYDENDKPVLNDDNEPFYKRAFSSYIEIGYTQKLPLGMSLGLQVGMTPWKSLYTGYEGKFAVNNVTLKFNEELEVSDHFTLDIFAQAMVNTYNIDKTNWWISEAGTAKFDQKFNVMAGIGFWF